MTFIAWAIGLPLLIHVIEERNIKLENYRKVLYIPQFAYFIAINTLHLRIKQVKLAKVNWNFQYSLLIQRPQAAWEKILFSVSTQTNNKLYIV